MDLYYDRKKQGLCVKCATPTIENKVLCEKCRKKNKIRYEEVKKNGICTYCRQEKTIGSNVLCDKCKQKESIRRKAEREFYTKFGICPRCRKNSLIGSQKNCSECNEKMREVNSIYKENGSFDAKEYNRKRYIELKTSGYCVKCRKRKQELQRTTCSICGALERMRHNNGKILRHERSSYGLCYICGKELDRQGKACIKCAKTATENLQKGGKKNEEWNKINSLLFSKITKEE